MTRTELPVRLFGAAAELDAMALNFLNRLRRHQPTKRAFTATPHTTYADSVRLANGQLSAEQFRAVIRRNVDLIHADRDDLAKNAPVERDAARSSRSRLNRRSGLRDGEPSRRGSGG